MVAIPGEGLMTLSSPPSTKECQQHHSPEGGAVLTKVVAADEPRSTALIDLMAVELLCAFLSKLWATLTLLHT